MNKNDLVTAMATESGMTKKDSELALNAIVASIGEALEKEDKVVLVGFGTFEVRSRKERKGRNPRTNEEMLIPATKAPVFKAGKSFKDDVK